jgi:hypothetical protein
MYTLASVTIDGDNLILTLSTPIAGFDAPTLQRLIDLVSPPPSAPTILATRTDRGKS